MAEEYIVQMKGISKRFGNVQALDNVDLDLRPGEILGLVGDNAAGKSTLMKTLYGAIAPDQGTILIDGQPVRFRSPRDAQRAGIAMIYQDLAIFNNLDVALNAFAGREYTRRVLGIEFLDKKRMHEESAQLLKRLKINISDTHLLVERMSGGQRQMVACARAIGCQCRVLIMDEPAAALGVREANTLLKQIAELRDQGLAIIMITQRIPDVLAIGNRCMVLKAGQCHGVLNVNECTLDDIVGLIIRGRALADQVDVMSLG